MLNGVGHYVGTIDYLVTLAMEGVDKEVLCGTQDRARIKVTEKERWIKFKEHAILRCTSD